jgi:hypothetical protein
MNTQGWSVETWLKEWIIWDSPNHGRPWDKCDASKSRSEIYWVSGNSVVSEKRNQVFPVIAFNVTPEDDISCWNILFRSVVLFVIFYFVTFNNIQLAKCIMKSTNVRGSDEKVTHTYQSVDALKFFHSRRKSLGQCLFSRRGGFRG